MMLIKNLYFQLTLLTILNAAFGARLKCKFEITYWTHAGTIYTCNIQDSGIFNDSPVTIDSIEGQHMSGYSNTQVKALIVDSKSNLNSFFPMNIEKHFMNLEVISISNSQLEEINENNLQHFPNLKHFTLRYSKIKIINRDTFKFNPELKAIWLNNNEISHIDYDAFSELKNLQWLNLSGNKCMKLINKADSRSETLKRIEQVKNGDCYDTVTIKINSEVKILEQNLKSHDENNKKMFNEIENKFSAIVTKIKRNHEEIIREVNKKIEFFINENLQLKSDVIALKSKDEQQNMEIQKHYNDKMEMQAEIQTLRENFQSTIKTMKDHFVEISSYNNLHNQLMNSNRELTAEYKTITDEIKLLTSDNVNIKFKIAVLQANTNDIQRNHNKVAEEQINLENCCPKAATDENDNL